MSGETFEALLTPNLRGVRTLVYKRLSDSGCADDVMQEILLRAFIHRHQLRVHSRFKTWLWSIALNEIRSFFRTHRGTVPLDDFPNIDVCDSAMSPLERLERTEMRDLVRTCIGKLEKRDRVAVRLRDIDGKSLQETAAVLDISESATKTAHFRARKRLARVVLANGYRPPLAA